MKRPVLLLILAAAMTLFLAFMVMSHELARSSGHEVMLDMRPVDPRSLFRGHYVRIQLDVQNLDMSKLKSDTDYRKGERVYVTLSGNNQKGWKPVTVSGKRPPTGIFLQGRVQSVRHKAMQDDQPPALSGLHVQYAVSSYFASHDEAKAMEAKMRDDKHKMRLILSVAKDGKPVIRGLEIDGKRYTDKL